MLKKIIKNGVSLLKFESKTLHSLYERKADIAVGVGIVAAPFLVNLLLLSLNYPSGFGSIFSRFVFWNALIPGISLVVTFFLMSLFVDKVYKKKVHYKKDFYVLSYACLAFWIYVIPFLLGFLGFVDVGGLFQLLFVGALIWVLMVARMLYKEIYKLKDQDAIVTVIAAFVIYFVIQGVLGNVLIGKYYNFFY